MEKKPVKIKFMKYIILSIIAILSFIIGMNAGKEIQKEYFQKEYPYVENFRAKKLTETEGDIWLINTPSNQVLVYSAKERRWKSIWQDTVNVRTF